MRAYNALALPTSVWLPPMMLVFATTRDHTPPHIVALTMAGVYAVIAGGNQLFGRVPHQKQA